ncbi:MAG: YidC/Oxa1 family insertase periplasmic-domain containing protein [Planctomycetota bacterium]
MKKALVPIVAVAVALLFGLAMFLNSGNSGSSGSNTGAAPTQDAATAEVDAASPTSDAAESAAPVDADPAPAAAEQPPDTPAVAETPTPAPLATTPDPTPAATPTEPVDRALAFADAASAENVTLGSTDPASGFVTEVQLTKWGAGIWRIELTDYKATAESNEPYVLLDGPVAAEFNGSVYSAYTFAAKTLFVDGQPYDLERVAWGVHEVRRVDGPDSPVTSVTYVASLVDGDRDGQPVVDVFRTWTLPRGGYDLTLDQQIVNRTDTPLSIAYSQYLQGDVVDDGPAYLGDRRIFATGYLRPGNTTQVFTGSSGIFGSSGAGFRIRTDVIDDATYNASRGQRGGVWPNPSLTIGSQLVWLASENRYFNIIAHPEVTDPAAGLAAVTPLGQQFPAIETHPLPGLAVAPEGFEVARAVIFSGTTATQTLAPGAAESIDLGVYVGPRDSEAFNASPVYRVLNFDALIRYELGCTFCTFQWIAHGLLWYLEFIHGDVLLRWTGYPIGVWDWGVSIIILVVTVRLLLHPITKTAQVNMMKMSKGMQAIQPELEKLKKKYKDDQKTLQQEMTKLYREKGINPLGFLGCLPMFLQMPIWVALYAMLYYAIELRNQPAFYGVFQKVSGGHWHFLESLSEPDQFIRLFNNVDPIPLLFITFDYSAINILPLLMGVVFYVNMKFTTPPPPENESDEQKQMRRQQQLIMKVMPFLMPFFLYSAPSGLTLYICASTGAGILDSYLVRKHIREQEEKGELFKKKERKPGGLMDKVGKYMEAKQAQFAELQAQQAAQQAKREGKGGGNKSRKKK